LAHYSDMRLFTCVLLSSLNICIQGLQTPARPVHGLPMSLAPCCCVMRSG